MEDQYMKMEDQETTAIKCKKCGSPSYFDQKAGEFVCPYCATFTPWESADYSYTLDMVFRHRPIPIIDGLIKLTHVGMTLRDVEDMRSSDEMKQRTGSLNDLLQNHDKKTFDTWEQREEISFDCPNCGGKITGYSTQSLFICEYCGNKIMASDVFTSGSYGENLIFGYGFNMYKQALPFKITKTQAIEQLRRLVRENRDDFAEENIEQRIESDLQAIYLPYLIEDFSLRTYVDTERGRFTLYHDRINWGLPQSTLFDIYLLNQLNPWDYGETEHFTPAFLEKEVRIFAPMNDEQLWTEPYRILYRDIPEMLKSEFGLNDVELLRWMTDSRRHQNSGINLPIWFLDKASETKESDLQIRMAVNGQTGKAVALFLQAGKKDYFRTLDLYPPPKMSDESTIYSQPIAIEYKKSPFLYKTYDINQVLGKPRSKFRRRFGKNGFMKFRTFVSLCIHIVLGFALGIYMLFFSEDLADGVFATVAAAFLMAALSFGLTVGIMRGFDTLEIIWARFKRILRGSIKH